MSLIRNAFFSASRRNSDLAGCRKVVNSRCGNVRSTCFNAVYISIGVHSSNSRIARILGNCCFSYITGTERSGEFFTANYSQISSFFIYLIRNYTKKESSKKDKEREKRRRMTSLTEWKRSESSDRSFKKKRRNCSGIVKTQCRF